MTLEPIVFFDLIIAIFILSLSLAAIVISYTKTVRKLHDLHKEKSAAQREMHKKTDHILEEAREKVAKKQLDEELKGIQESQVKTLEKLSYDFLNAYQKELTELKENNIIMMKNISKDIENATIAELKDYKEILKKETYDSQKIVQDKIEETYKSTQKEIEDYKTVQLKKVEGQIYEIIENVSKIVLGKSLSLQEHEQLVIDALEKAKKEGTL